MKIAYGTPDKGSQTSSKVHSGSDPKTKNLEYNDGLNLGVAEAHNWFGSRSHNWFWFRSHNWFLFRSHNWFWFRSHNFVPIGGTFISVKVETISITTVFIIITRIFRKRGAGVAVDIKAIIIAAEFVFGGSSQQVMLDLIPRFDFKICSCPNKIIYQQ